MRLYLTNTGHIPSNYPRTFYRVETWATGHYVADFTNEGEAATFAIKDAAALRYDHKVSRINLG